MVEISNGSEPGKTAPLRSLLRVVRGQPRSADSTRPSDVVESAEAKQARVIQRVFGDYVGGEVIKHFPSDPDSASMIWLKKEEAGADGKSHVVKLAGLSNQGKIIMPDGQAASEPEIVAWGLPLLGEIQTRLNQAKEDSIAKDPRQMGDVDAILNAALIDTAVRTVERELNVHPQTSSGQ